MYAKDGLLYGVKLYHKSMYTQWIIIAWIPKSNVHRKYIISSNSQMSCVSLFKKYLLKTWTDEQMRG